MSTFSVAFENWLARGALYPTSVRNRLKTHDSAFHRAPTPSPPKTSAGELAALFARDQHLRAGGAFGIGQNAVLLHDQRAPQRHHHQHAEDAAGQRQHRDLEVVEVAGAAGEENQRRHREDDAAGDRFAGRPDRLDDVVLENGRSAERFRTEIASTAIGIEALTVSPARRPRYTVDAPKSSPNSAPMTTAFSVNSAGDSLAET